MKEWINQLSSNEVAMLVTFVLFVASVILAILFGYIPNRRKKKIEQLQQKIKERTTELLAVYKDVQALIQVESFLCTDADTNKKKAREGFSISYRCEPKRVEKRIAELEKAIN